MEGTKRTGKYARSSGDGQSPVTARLCDITSHHEIRHKCDTLLKHCNFTTTTPFLAILFVSKISFNVYHVLN